MKPVSGHALDYLHAYRYHNGGHDIVAQCQCREQSPGGLTVARRRQWHRDHKAEIEPELARKPELAPIYTIEANQ